MRVIRSDNEKVIAAQSNNSKYDYNYGESNFDYDFCVEHTFSDKKFMNELARDRVYGIANMRPIKRSKSVVKEGVPLTITVAEPPEVVEDVIVPNEE